MHFMDSEAEHVTVNNTYCQMLIWFKFCGPVLNLLSLYDK